MHRYASEKEGIPINPQPQTRHSLRREFWEDLISIFMVPAPDNFLDILLSIIFAIYFIIRWGWYLICRLFGSTRTAPTMKKDLKRH